MSSPQCNRIEKIIGWAKNTVGREPKLVPILFSSKNNPRLLAACTAQKRDKNKRTMRVGTLKLPRMSHYTHAHFGQSIAFYGQ